jgi:glycosyltransferase involved in cell wall biosynthesis
MAADMETELPLVSAVIPTRNRPAIVCRAVRSALNQTYRNLEVIVVVDGPDPATVSALEELNEARLRVISLAENVGGSEARNVGVREARGEWIALLDDDDEWFPEKINRQIMITASLVDKNVFIASRFSDLSSGKGHTAPIRMPDTGEPIDEYLCCPRGYRAGTTFLQTSTLLVHRELLLRVPFEKGLKRGQEFSWMLMACTTGNAAYYVASDILSVFNSEGNALQRISTRPQWRSYYAWMRGHKKCFSPKAYSFCIATYVLHDAIKCNEPFRVRWNLSRDSVRDGRINFKCAIKLLYALFVPHTVRFLLSRIFQALPKRISGQAA